MTNKGKNKMYLVFVQIKVIYFPGVLNLLGFNTSRKLKIRSLQNTTGVNTKYFTFVLFSKQSLSFHTYELQTLWI